MRDTMQASAASGCNWCAFILGDGQYVANATAEKIRVALSVWAIWNEGDFPVQLIGVGIHGQDGQSRRQVLDCSIYAEHGKLKTIVFGHEVSNDLILS